MRPWTLIGIGFLLSMLGITLPLLMLIHLLTSTFFLNFLSFTASMSGLLLGIIGSALIFRSRRK